MEGSENKDAKEKDLMQDNSQDRNAGNSDNKEKDESNPNSQEKNQLTSNDGNEGDVAENNEKENAVDKEQLKREILEEMGLDASQVERFKKISKLFSEEGEEDKADPNAVVEELEKRAEAAEMKAELMKQGISPAYIDDAVVLFNAKKESTKQFVMKDAIVEFKNRYPEWFASEEAGKKFSGTGSSLRSKGSGSGEDKKGLGARLAASRAPKAAKKSYWG